jgi:predicted acylesterase/phospholipase RssA
MNTEQAEVTAVSFGGGGQCGTGRHIAVAERYRNSNIARWMGTSIGGFIALLIANGFSEAQMKDAMYRLWRPSATSIVRAVAPKCINPVKLLKGELRQVQKAASYMGLIDQTAHIKEWCKNLEWNNAQFGLFDLLSGSLTVVDKEFGMPLHLALSATMAVPGVFSPIAWTDGEGRKYLFVDGGIKHCHPTVDGHKTAVAKCMSFPGRDRIWPDSDGDVILDIGVMPGLNVLLPSSREEIDQQVEEARDRIKAL